MESEGLDNHLQLSANESINIVHISDPQFGGFDHSLLSLEADLCAQVIREKFGSQGPTFFAITGDISEHGLPQEFVAAKKWLSELVAQFGLKIPNSRILLVPGNHDVCLPLACASRVGLDEKTKKLKINQDDTNIGLSNFAMRPYLDFEKAVVGNNRFAGLSNLLALDPSVEFQNSLPWVEMRFRGFGVLFSGINSAFPVSSSSTPGQEMWPDALSSIGKCLREKMRDSVDPILIHLSHHSPISVGENRSISNPQAFDRFRQAVSMPKILLHGHAHERKVFDHDGMVICSAPTLSKTARPPDTLRGFSLLEFSRDRDCVLSVAVTQCGVEGTKLELNAVREFKVHSDRKDFIKG